MRGRLIIAIVSTLLEELVMVVVALWALPRFGLYVPIWVLVVLLLGWNAQAILFFRAGTRALKRDIVPFTAMAGSQGTVVRPLDPEGSVRIKAETWQAVAEDGSIETAAEVTVVGQDRLKLIVRRSHTADLKEDG
ncbi:NfeD family protein [Chloroflexota bacterium]